MEISRRIPDLSDGELGRLHVNAVRLAQSGTLVQRQQAEALLAPIGADLARRASEGAAARALQRRASALRKTISAEAMKGEA